LSSRAALARLVLIEETLLWQNAICIFSFLASYLQRHSRVCRRAYYFPKEKFIAKEEAARKELLLSAGLITPHVI
jgi:hypothetical protein